MSAAFLTRPTAATLLLALPKGRMQQGVIELLTDAGMPVRLSERSYRPRLHLPGIEAKLLKPQSIIEMLAAGSRHLGFAGRDWVEELGGELVELLDTGLNPVRIVAAAPTSILEAGALPKRRLVVASEYERLTRAWIAELELDAQFVRSYGATEVFPPEDADVIVDNTATGDTLRANGLEIVDELLTSSTRLFASPRALDDPAIRGRIDDFVVLLRSVLDARTRVMLELNVDRARLEAVTALLPSMRRATVSPLHHEDGFAVKSAVPRAQLAELIPLVRAAGGTDLVVTEIAQLVP